MKTTLQILEKIEKHRNDFLGFIASDLIVYLDFDDAKKFLKEGVKKEEWKASSRDPESIKKQMHDYMAFAWGKANDCRGLSAARSLEHCRAWLFMLGEDAMSDHLRDYSHYGKPQLRAVCEFFKWDWTQWDDGQWVNREYEEGSAAKDIPVIPWQHTAQCS